MSVPVALVWLLFYILITLVPLPNYVLCIGGDGRGELEVGANGLCADAHAFDS